MKSLICYNRIIGTILRDYLMTSSILKNKLINEINLIPDEMLSEVYSFVHYFRLGTEKGVKNKKDLLSFSGAWNDIGDEKFSNYMEDIANRRRNAFSDRRENETISD
jgi:hypothetical protein